MSLVIARKPCALSNLLVAAGSCLAGAPGRVRLTLGLSFELASEEPPALPYQRSYQRSYPRRR